jgi:hypothetical protein
LLKRLDDAGQLNETEVIAIEEHVDYWDRLGWIDPFSSHEWTTRQENYAHTLRHDGVYTPQLVVNGSHDLVGSSPDAVRAAVSDAAKIRTARLQVQATLLSPQEGTLAISVEDVPPEAHAAQLWIAVTERKLSSNVLHGENEGRMLSHAAILRSLSPVKVPKLGSSASTHTTAAVRLDPSWKRENLRFVVFLQEPKTLHIFGAAAVIPDR